jgi:ubiquinone biosynthesis monooxygenase Coq7
MLDRIIIEFDKGLRTLLAKAHSSRQHPDRGIAEAALENDEKKHAAALMRVNHSGEVCAQALYSGQSLTAKQKNTAEALKQAAKEETEHLAWCEERIKSLGGRTSLLNPLWYAGSFTLGAIAGALGDKWNLGFLAETELQVEKHLKSHLNSLPAKDTKSRLIVEQMQADEAKHAATAYQHGAAELPKPVKSGMQLISKLMTKTSYHL